MPRQKFIGNWIADKAIGDSSATIQYPISILAGYPEYKVLIKNVDNYFSQYLYANTWGEDSLVIYKQGLQGKVISGACHYVSSSDIEVHYDIIDSATNQVVSVNTKWHN